MSEMNEFSSSQGIESLESHLLDSEGLALLRKITQDPEAYLEQASEFRQGETVEKQSIELSSEEFLGPGSDFESFLALLGENPDTAQAIIENILPEDPALISSGQAGNAVASGLDSYGDSEQEVETPGDYYIVASSDTLSAIALRLYGHASYWRFIYEANRELIGDNPNIIISGQELVIPSLEDLETVPATVVSGEYTYPDTPMTANGEPVELAEDMEAPATEEVVVDAPPSEEPATEASAGEVVEPETAVEETAVAETMVAEATIPEESIEETLTPDILMEEVPEAEIPSDTPTAEETEVLVEDVPSDAVSTAEAPTSDSASPEDQATADGVSAESPASQEPGTEASPTEVPAQEEAVAETPAEVTPPAEALAPEEPTAEVPAKEMVAEEEPVAETPVEEVVVSETPIEEATVQETPAAEVPTPEEPVEGTPAPDETVDEAPDTETPPEPIPEETTTETPPVESPLAEEPVSETPIEKIAEPEEAVDASIPQETVTETPAEEAPVVEEPVQEEQPAEISPKEEATEESPAPPEPEVEAPAGEAADDAHDESSDDHDGGDQPSDDNDDDWIPHDETAEVTVDDIDQLQQTEEPPEEATDESSEAEVPEADEVTPIQQESPLSSHEEMSTDAPAQEPSTQQDLDTEAQPAEVSDLEESEPGTPTEESRQPDESTFEQRAMRLAELLKLASRGVSVDEEFLLPPGWYDAQLDELYEWASPGVSPEEEFIARHLPAGWYEMTPEEQAQFKARDIKIRDPWNPSKRIWIWEDPLTYQLLNEEKISEMLFDGDVVEEQVPWLLKPWYELDPVSVILPDVLLNLSGIHGFEQIFFSEPETGGGTFDAQHELPKGYDFESFIADFYLGYSPSGEAQWPQLSKDDPTSVYIQAHILAGNLSVEEANQLVEARGFKPPDWVLPPNMQEPTSEAPTDEGEQLAGQYTTQEILEMRLRNEITDEEAAQMWEEAYEQEGGQETSEPTQNLREIVAEQQQIDTRLDELRQEKESLLSKNIPFRVPFDTFLTLINSASDNPSRDISDIPSEEDRLMWAAFALIGLAGQAGATVSNAQSAIEVLRHTNPDDLDPILNSMGIVGSQLSLTKQLADSFIREAQINEEIGELKERREHIDIQAEQYIEQIGVVIEASDSAQIDDQQLTILEQVGIGTLSPEEAGEKLTEIWWPDADTPPTEIDQQLSILQQVQDGQLTPEQAGEQMTGIFLPETELPSVESTPLFDSDGHPISRTRMSGSYAGQIVGYNHHGDPMTVTREGELISMYLYGKFHRFVPPPPPEVSLSEAPADVNEQQPSTLEQVLITGDLTPEEGIQFTSEKIDTLETQIAELTTLHDELSELDFTLALGEPGLPSSTEEAIERLLSSVAAVIPGGIYIGDVVEEAIQSAEIADQLAEQINQLEMELDVEKADLEVLEGQVGQASVQEEQISEQSQVTTEETYMSDNLSLGDVNVKPSEAVSEMQPGIPLTDEQANDLGVPWYRPLVPPPPMRDLWNQVWAGDLTPEEASQQAVEMGFQKAPDTWDIPPETGETWDQLISGEMNREEWEKQQEQRVESAPEEITNEVTQTESPPTEEQGTDMQLAEEKEPVVQQEPTEDIIPADSPTEASVEEQVPIEPIVEQPTTLETSATEEPAEATPAETFAAEKKDEAKIEEDTTVETSAEESITPEDSEVMSHSTEDETAEETDEEERSAEDDTETDSPPTEYEIAVETVTEDQPAEDNAEIETPPTEDTSVEDSESG